MFVLYSLSLFIHTGSCTSGFSYDVTPSAYVWNGKERALISVNQSDFAGIQLL